MGTALYAIPLEDGGEIVVEIELGNLGGGVALAAEPGEIAARAGEPLETMLGRVRPAVTAVVDQFRRAARAPEQVQVEFGLTFGGETGVIFTKGRIESTLTVTVTWSGDSDDTAKAQPGGSGARTG